MQEHILILHHATSQTTAGRKLNCRQSTARVMDEVLPVAQALQRLGLKYEIEAVERIEQVPQVLRGSQAAVIFNLVEELAGGPLDSCYVPAVCRAHGRACTGNDTACLVLAQDKWKMRAVLQAAGVPCPAGVLVPVGSEVPPGCKNPADQLGPGRYIVKPVLQDASEGIDSRSVVDCPGQSLSRAVRRIHNQLNQPALVEQFIPQREINASVLQHPDGTVQVLPLAEIDFSAFGPDRPRIVDYSAKWHTDSFAYNNTPHIIPAPLAPQTQKLISQYALAAWQAAGCRGFARVDFRLDEDDQAFALEVNPNPDISMDAGFPPALAAAQISYEDFVAMLLENASSDY